MSKTLDEMVLPGKEASWEHSKKKWFVLDLEKQLREPGMLFRFYTLSQINSICGIIYILI